MGRPLLAIGAKGNSVEELQNLLNKWLDKNDYDSIKTDRDFGTYTKEAIESFQFSKFLSVDGIVGPLTWAALLETERFNYFDIPTPLVRSPDPFRCWAASGAMLLKQGTLLSKTPGVKFEPRPGGKVGGLYNSHENMRKFANYHKMTMVRAGGFSCLQLTTLLYRYGRLMLNVKGVNTSMKASSPDDSHLVVMLGARGSGEPGGTTITIFNPSGGGAKITSSYQYLKGLYPQLTYQVFYTDTNRSMPK